MFWDCKRMLVRSLYVLHVLVYTRLFHNLFVVLWLVSWSSCHIQQLEPFHRSGFDHSCICCILVENLAVFNAWINPCFSSKYDVWFGTVKYIVQLALFSFDRLKMYIYHAYCVCGVWCWFRFPRIIWSGWLDRPEISCVSWTVDRCVWKNAELVGSTKD